MLILRVAEGNAWQKDTMDSVGMLSPEHGGPSGAEHSDGSGAEVAFHLRCQSTSQVISNCAKETLHSTSDKILVHILLGGIGV